MLWPVSLRRGLVQSGKMHLDTSPVSTYCWWRKSCATWDVHNPVNNGINYLSTGGRISSTNSMYIPSTLLPSAYANQSAQNYRTNEGGLARKESSNLYYVQMQNIHPYMIFMCSMIYGRFFSTDPSQHNLCIFWHVLCCFCSRARERWLASRSGYNIYLMTVCCNFISMLILCSKTPSNKKPWSWNQSSPADHIFIISSQKCPWLPIRLSTWSTSWVSPT